MSDTFRCEDCGEVVATATAINSHCRVSHGRKASAEEQTPEPAVDMVTPDATGLVFEEPPPVASHPGRSGYVALLAPLKDHPGRWARVRELATAESAKTAAYRISKGGAVGLPKGEWEARGGTKDGKNYLWVRYVGGAS